MTVALDLGSSEFRSLRHADHKLIARRLPAVYTVLDDQPATRRFLEQSQISYSAVTGSLVVIGEAAAEVSTLLSRPLIPLLRGGHLADEDPIGRQVCAWMIELLLPPARSPQDVCLLTLPRGEIGGAAAHEWSSLFLEHVVELQGYRTIVVHPTTALALAELEDCEFSGACLTVGAESINFGLIRQSQPLIEAHYLKGTREVLERYAHAQKFYLWDQQGNSYLNLPQVHHSLTNEELSLSEPNSDRASWLRDAFAELLLSAMFSVKRKILRCDEAILHQPLPLVIAGGVTGLQGFATVVEEAMKLSGIPLQIRSIRRATFEPYSIARGLLIQGSVNAGEFATQMPEVEAA